MDSITQAALGAAVQYAVQGRHIGRKALLWGAFFGTLPDLDVLLAPWQSAMEELASHRGISHSILLNTATAPLWALLLAKLHPGTTFLRSWMAVFLALITHPLIDCFTVYGTQVWEPFSSQRVAFNNMFIIDPLFTLPLLAACACAGFWGKANPQGAAKAMCWGLALSTAYVGWSLAAKEIIGTKVRHRLENETAEVMRWQTTPTAFNTVLWRILAEEKDSFRIGYLAVWETPDRIRWTRVRRQEELLEGLPVEWRKQLLWFSCGYYALKAEGNGVVFSDLRFGEVPPVFQPRPEPPDFFFSWKFVPGEPEPVRSLVPRRGTSRQGILAAAWNRIWNSEAPEGGGEFGFDPGNFVR